MKSFLILIYFVCAPVFFSQAAENKIANISAEFNAQKLMYMDLVVSYEENKEQPFLVSKKTAFDIGYELFSFYTDGEYDLKYFKESVWEPRATDKSWETDGSNYGEITYQEALEYVEGGSMLMDTDKTSMEYKESVRIFKQMKNQKNVIYIVAPEGATPCGDITLPAVLIIDLETNQVYNLRTDSSEC